MAQEAAQQNQESGEKSEFTAFLEHLKSQGYVAEIDDDSARVDVYPMSSEGQKFEDAKGEGIPRYVISDKKTFQPKLLYFTIPGNRELATASWVGDHWEAHPN